MNTCPYCFSSPVDPLAVGQAAGASASQIQGQPIEESSSKSFLTFSHAFNSRTWRCICDSKVPIALLRGPNRREMPCSKSMIAKKKGHFSFYGAFVPSEAANHTR